MGIEIKSVVPIGIVRKEFTQLAEETQAGDEKLITKDGKPYVAIISADRLAYYHQLEKERQLASILDVAEAALNDIEAGNVMTVDELKAKLGRR
jgi:antitoxin (DNA-binding transcriptional repressor) of toxin-antitoxin stability system